MTANEVVSDGSDREHLIRFVNRAPTRGTTWGEFALALDVANKLPSTMRMQMPNRRHVPVVRLGEDAGTHSAFYGTMLTFSRG